MEKIKCIGCGRDDVNITVIHVGFQCYACGMKFHGCDEDEKYLKNIGIIKQTNEDLFSLFNETIKKMDQMGIGLSKDLKKKVDAIKEVVK